MNYRHAYHAGNFADVMKHALLYALIRALSRKSTPFTVLDTHAGIGLYDLSSPEAQATGEWRDGIGRLLDLPPETPDLAPIADWLALVRQIMREHGARMVYPGSPDLAAHMLRPADTLVCCELHPEDQRYLRRLFRNNPAVSVHHRDAYEAITALLPPKTAKRGLVLIDPPFEKRSEFGDLVQAVAKARQRFPGCIVAVWYPVKHRAPPRAFFNALKDSGQRNLLNLELTVRPPLDPEKLNGCGLLIANPPFRFDEESTAILSTLCHHLGHGETESLVEWIVPE
ncbi:23S rRNA (adenine(2030)-N(6))-methyltransferase RlmJ [Acetobacter conturbans]|uniref:Ribosomal RNA large subunit methyltransferase J n=1 Tax=Acetobacter conturbans TaxID=1737472 RepID=A0ABX0K357_9PROT|nr:23S rRNA (adenine(2030)-N(6))-methyltransferase RlmJ [Acetobacter conturbans]NHN89637.1 23S rRNA (adenine(2030)-N(6))-methyltransferase RlmJ [Acetobacter conturbans]